MWALLKELHSLATVAGKVGMYLKWTESGARAGCYVGQFVWVSKFPLLSLKLGQGLLHLHPLLGGVFEPMTPSEEY